MSNQTFTPPFRSESMRADVATIAVAGFFLLMTLLASIYFMYKALRMNDSRHQTTDIGIVLSDAPSRKLKVEGSSAILALLLMWVTAACTFGSFGLRKPEQHHGLLVVFSSMDLTAVFILFVLAIIRYKHNKKREVKLFVAWGAIMLVMGGLAISLVAVGTYTIQKYFALATLLLNIASFWSPLVEIERRPNPVIPRVIEDPFSGVDPLSPPQSQLPRPLDVVGRSENNVGVGIS